MKSKQFPPAEAPRQRPCAAPRLHRVCVASFASCASADAAALAAAAAATRRTARPAARVGRSGERRTDVVPLVDDEAAQAEPACRLLREDCAGEAAAYDDEVIVVPQPIQALLAVKAGHGAARRPGEEAGSGVRGRARRASKQRRRAARGAATHRSPAAAARLLLRLTRGGGGETELRVRWGLPLPARRADSVRARRAATHTAAVRAQTSASASWRPRTHASRERASSAKRHSAPLPARAAPGWPLRRRRVRLR